MTDRPRCLRKVILPPRSGRPELPRLSVKRKSESPDRRDDADREDERDRQEEGEANVDTPMPPTDSEVPTPFGSRTEHVEETSGDAPIPPASRGRADKDYEQALVEENTAASGDETFMVEGRLKPSSKDDVATEGRVTVIRYKLFVSKVPKCLESAEMQWGGWEIGQFPKKSQPIWLSTIWEVGKLGNDYRYILLNFPISQFPK